LTDQQMQALSREMNLSETTFILPREPEIEAENGKRVRIFTVDEELPFAGHPTLGTSLYLYHAASSAPDKISLELNVGKIDIRFRADSQRVSGEGAGKQHARAGSKCAPACFSMAEKIRRLDQLLVVP